MQVILADHNCEGQAKLIFEALQYDGIWLDLAPMELRWFRDIGLATSASDEIVWRFCQERGYLLLTGNRTNDDKAESLESVVHQLFTTDSLPVLTISNLKRVKPAPAYRKRCAVRLAEIVYDLPSYRGTMRLFIP
jgi:hypothetical protein